jgi:thiosulfate/3-mercaptopyruvate sulfurtransferase
MKLRLGLGGLAAAGFALSAPPSAVGQVPRLVTTEELATWLVPDRPEDGLVSRGMVTVVDVRQSWVSYLQNHLPEAVWLNVETLRAQQRELPFQLLSGSQYAELFGRLGIRPSGVVAIYSAGDQLDIDATFVAWILASAGASRVYVVDGGYAKWELEGRPLTQRYPRRTVPAEAFRPKAFRASVASLEEVRAAVAGSGALLVDARPPEQFTGAAGAQIRRGHIPGAVNHSWKDDLEKPDLVLVWKSPEALRNAYAAQGILPESDIILYCNSGTEASHVLFALKYLLEYPRVRIFVGSWTQWAEREELPVER